MLFTNLLLATLATLSAAEVALESSPSVGVFSFAEWIEGIIQNPDGDNLTPEEAYAAWELSVNQTELSGRKPLQHAALPPPFPPSLTSILEATLILKSFSPRRPGETRNTV